MVSHLSFKKVEFNFEKWLAVSLKIMFWQKWESYAGDISNKVRIQIPVVLIANPDTHKKTRKEKATFMVVHTKN